MCWGRRSLNSIWIYSVEIYGYWDPYRSWIYTSYVHCAQLNYQRVLAFIYTKGYGSTYAVDTSLSLYPWTHSNFSIYPLVHPCILRWYLTSCNVICKHNDVQKFYLSIEKYWVIQNIYFIIETTVTLGMGETDAKPIFFHSILDKNRYNEITVRKLKLKYSVWLIQY